MRDKPHIHLGFEKGTGVQVSIPLGHMAVTGQTQESGKTTTLEALASRADVKAIVFITKRGETSFATARRVDPYFRDRADWQFVASIIDATLRERNKFLRSWIMKVCRSTKTLAEVQAAVRLALTTAKGVNHGVYTQIDAYLDLIVPEIARAKLATSLDLRAGLNVMDVSDFDTPMQMLFIQSALDWVNAKERNVVVVIPEAWEFVPEGRSSPVKASAVALARRGAALNNYIWVDSQDMAGVDKTILRCCTLWLIGVQREANEIKRNLSNIPAGIKKPRADEISMQELGFFYACWKDHVTQTYAQPIWMTVKDARAIAMGEPVDEGDTVNQAQADQLMQENAALRRTVQELEEQLRSQNRQSIVMAHASTDDLKQLAKIAAIDPDTGFKPLADESDGSLNELTYQRIKNRLMQEAPSLIRLLTTNHEIDVTVVRHTIAVDDKTPRGRIIKMLANGFFKTHRTNAACDCELRRTGKSVNSGTISTTIAELLSMGFLTKESSGYLEVPGMKANIKKSP